ncbi:MAG: sigma-54-dependent Fis family transcriptional regulator [Candidatus Riflebacteria bacterium]|nr:sigma-54-dependent Fis family transcriptional regulator [Candidatus Riflebacteria bacterium]
MKTESTICPWSNDCQNRKCPMKINSFGIFGTSENIQSILQQISLVAGSDEPVLILGPTGSGKELIARAIHQASNRKGPFISDNAAYFSGNPQMTESRLFGHCRGAFTGAENERKGLFLEADGGTLFLDEIGELSLDSQALLLRVLDQKAIARVGESRTRKVNARIVAATNRNLQKMVQAGTFRADLFYRLNVLSIKVLPIKDRKEDLKCIAQKALHELSPGKNFTGLDKNAWDSIFDYDWPGNVRQFINCLKNSMILGIAIQDSVAREKIQEPEEENDEAFPTSKTGLFPQRIEEVSPAEVFYAAYLRHVFKLCQGNITKASKILGVSQNTLRKYLIDEADHLSKNE